MSTAQIQNLTSYAALALIGALLATGVLLGQQLAGTDPILWRPLAAMFVSSFFGTLVTTAGAAFLPRAGHEQIAALVDNVGHSNAVAALQDAAVGQAVAAPLGPPPGLDAFAEAVAARAVEKIEARMRATPAETGAP